MSEHGGLAPAQRARLDEALQQMDRALGGAVPEETRALARAVVEISFWSTVHLDNNLRQVVIAEREALLDRVRPMLETIDRGLSVNTEITEQMIDRMDAQDVRLDEVDAKVAEHGRVIRAQFWLIAMGVVAVCVLVLTALILLGRLV